MAFAPPSPSSPMVAASRAGRGVVYLAIPLHGQLTAAISTRGRITVDVLYGDHEGRQPSVTRFVLLPDADSWRCDATRYWSLPPGQR